MSPVGCSWIYTVKVNPGRSVAHLKARLVARGYSQTYSVDFRDPFSCIQNVWLFDFLSLLLFIQLGFTLFRCKRCFSSWWFVWRSVYGATNKVCCSRDKNGIELKKPFYGLKQSPRAWFDRFSQFVIEFGFLRCVVHHSVFLQVRFSW